MPNGRFAIINNDGQPVAQGKPTGVTVVGVDLSIDTGPYRLNPALIEVARSAQRASAERANRSLAARAEEGAPIVDIDPVSPPVTVRYPSGVNQGAQRATRVCNDCRHLKTDSAGDYFSWCRAFASYASTVQSRYNGQCPGFAAKPAAIVRPPGLFRRIWYWLFG